MKSKLSYAELEQILTYDIPSLICRFLPGGEITFVNNAYCKHFKKTSEELVGYSFLKLIPTEDRESVMANILSLTFDSPEMTHEHRVIDPNGKVIWHRWKNKALFDNLGKVILFQAIGEDITEQKEAELEVETLRQILPICAYCKNIRNDEGYYEQIETYIHKHSGVDFSHTVCPTCLKEHHPNVYMKNYPQDDGLE